MNRPLVFLFPGQSSRDKRMFERLTGISNEVAGKALDETRSRLGRELDLGFNGNKDIQLAVFSATIAYLQLLMEAGFEPAASAGLSLGEYSHLVEIGALEIQDAFDLVAARGDAYESGPKGIMAAIQPLSAENAEALSEELRHIYGWAAEDFAVSNDNSPTQCVVAGTSDAVNRFITIASERFDTVAGIVERRIPMHMARFAPVAEVFSTALNRAPWKRSRTAYWPNVTAVPVANADGEVIKAYLRRHVSEKVLWRQTVNALDLQYSDAVFVEVGPRDVLRNMLSRRWLGKDRVVSIDDERSSFREILSRIGALRGRA